MQTENQIQNVERDEEIQIAELELKIRKLKEKMRKEDTERKNKEYVEHFLSRLSKNCGRDAWLCQCEEKCREKCLKTTSEELLVGKIDIREYSREEKGFLVNEIDVLINCAERLVRSYQKGVATVMIYRLLNKNKWLMKERPKFHKTVINKCFEFMENRDYKEIAYLIGRTFFEEFNDPSVNVITKPIPNPPENTLYSQPEPNKEEKLCKQSIHCMVTRKRKMMETQNEEQLAKRQCV